MSERMLFVGLGNPGPKYDGTRHNVGFDWVDAVASSAGTSFSEKFEAAWLSFPSDSLEVHLLKPMTYMNLSGRSLQAWKKKFQGPFRLVVVLDDLDLPVGRLRLRSSGSTGGHRGLQSIIGVMGTEEVPRLRIGVGRPPDSEQVERYVLQRFPPEEKRAVKELMSLAPDHAKLLMGDEWDRAMNEINGFRLERGKA